MPNSGRELMKEITATKGQQTRASEAKGERLPGSLPLEFPMIFGCTN